MSVLSSEFYHEINSKTEFWKMVQKRAKQEINEPNEAVKKKKVKELKKLISEIENFKAPDLDDETYYLSFLRYAKFDMQKALKAVKKFFELKRDYPFLADLASLQEIIPRFSVFKDDFLAKRDHNGCIVVFFRLGTFDPTIMPPDEYIRLLYFVLQYIAFSTINQVVGIVAIIDCRGMHLNLIKCLTPKIVLAFSKMLQGSVPIRIRAFHVINLSFVFKVGLQIFLPFLKEKLKKRIFCYNKTEMGLFYKNFKDVEILPEDIGGNAPIREINIKLANDALNFEELFDDVRNSGFLK